MKTRCIFGYLLVFLLIFTIGCSKDDGPEVGSPEYYENLLTGNDWKWHSTRISFYKNGAVIADKESTDVASGGLSYDAFTYYGTWYLSGSKIVTKFAEGCILGNIVAENQPQEFEIGTIKDDYMILSSSEITASINKGVPKNDESDKTNHDKVLWGQWKIDGYMDGKLVTVNLDISSDGKVKATMKEPKVIDDTSGYSTSKGMVTFDNFLGVDGKRTFIYEKRYDKIYMYKRTPGNVNWKLYK